MLYDNLTLNLKQQVESQLRANLIPRLAGTFSDYYSTALDINPSVPSLDRSIREALCLPAISNVIEGYGSEGAMLLPSLVIYTYRANNRKPKDILPTAASIDFLLKASCLLDDIQDNDKPASLVARLGIGTSLNIALILLHFGQELLISSLEELSLSPKLSLGLLSQLSQVILQSSQGQLLDEHKDGILILQSGNGLNLTLERASMKTATITSYLTQLGAVIAIGSEAAQTAVYRDFGFYFGMVLHLINDLKDFVIGYESNQAGRDLKKKCLTFPLIYAYEELSSASLQNSLITLWESSIEGNAEDARQLVELINSTSATSQVLALAVSYLSQAEKTLKLLDPDLEQLEHQILIKNLQNLIKPFSRYFLKALV